MEPIQVQTPQDRKKKTYKAIGVYVTASTLLIGGTSLWWAFRDQFLTLLAGFIGPFLALAGIIVFAIAKSSKV